MDRLIKAEHLLERIRKETCYTPMLTDGTIQAVRDFLFKDVNESLSRRVPEEHIPAETCDCDSSVRDMSLHTLLCRNCGRPAKRVPQETAPKSAQIHCAECHGRCKHIASKPAEPTRDCDACQHNWAMGKKAFCPRHPYIPTKVMPAETAPKCHLGAKCFKLLPDAEECTCGFKGPAYRGPVKTTSKESK